VGEVILKGKRSFWGLPNQHYHQGMKAGESTLNAHCARVVTRSMIAAGGRYSTACYITDSWPSILYLAYKYADDLQAALLANTNLGGDNVHRGAVLGSSSALPPAGRWMRFSINLRSVRGLMRK